METDPAVEGTGTPGDSMRTGDSPAKTTNHIDVILTTLTCVLSRSCVFRTVCFCAKKAPALPSWPIAAVNGTVVGGVTSTPVDVHVDRARNSTVNLQCILTSLKYVVTTVLFLCAGPIPET